MRVFYPGQIGGPFGWGTFGQGFTDALRSMNALASTPEEADVIFIPAAGHGLAPSVQPWVSKLNFGMCFFESPLEPDAAKNAARYDLLFCGSTWNKQRLAERGIESEVLIQGVDHSIFKPGERKPDGQFRIFSGGKFEFRKGQDLVIAAFREFARSHPEAHLVCSWFNPWPQLIFDCINRNDLACKPPNGYAWDSQETMFRCLLRENGLKSKHFGDDIDQFTVLPRLSQPELAREMQNTDCGLFPNRCEGGTNLVLMEYAACGLPVVASPHTGHEDIIDHISSLEIVGKVSRVTGWAEHEVPWIVRAMEDLHYFHGVQTPLPIKKWTWQAAAAQVIRAAERLKK